MLMLVLALVLVFVLMLWYLFYDIFIKIGLNYWLLIIYIYEGDEDRGGYLVR